MPIASRMLSCRSRKNSCGSTCSTSRSSGSDDAARRFNRAPHVVALNIARPRAHCNPAAAIESAHVNAGDADQRRFHRHVYDRFRFFNRAPDRTDRQLQVHDLALAPALRFRGAERGKLRATPSSSISPISAQVFVLPTSSATIYRSFFVQFRRSLLSPRAILRLRVYTRFLCHMFLCPDASPSCLAAAFGYGLLCAFAVTASSAQVYALSLLRPAPRSQDSPPPRG